MKGHKWANRSLKIQSGLWPRFLGYFTLVQCCHEQTERVIPLSLCGQTGEKLVWC